MVNKDDELVKKLQKEARMLFYDRMMYDINDSLTSILAVCDDDKKGAIPKIKDCINRINTSLGDTRQYQSDFGSDVKFDIQLVIKNLIRVIKGYNREVAVKYLLPEIKAPATGDRAVFEELLLNIFIDILKKDSSKEEISIELKQKDKDAMVIISNNYCTLSEEVIREINNIKVDKNFIGNIQIRPQGGGIEVIIKIPLQFKVVKIDKIKQKEKQVA